MSAILDALREYGDKSFRPACFRTSGYRRESQGSPSPAISYEGITQKDREKGGGGEREERGKKSTVYNKTSLAFSFVQDSSRSSRYSPATVLPQSLFTTVRNFLSIKFSASYY